MKRFFFSWLNGEIVQYVGFPVSLALRAVTSGTEVQKDCSLKTAPGCCQRPPQGSRAADPARPHHHPTAGPACLRSSMLSGGSAAGGGTPEKTPENISEYWRGLQGMTIGVSPLGGCQLMQRPRGHEPIPLWARTRLGQRWRGWQCRQKGTGMHALSLQGQG